MNDMINVAKNIATEVHAGQMDKGGEAYILHPMTVASKVESDDEKIVAWLHDTVEDSRITLTDLKESGFSKEVINAVDAITKKQGQSYDEYINNLKENTIAVKVKIADLTHNSDITRINNPTQKDFERIEKYTRIKRELIEYLKTERKGQGLA